MSRAFERILKSRGATYGALLAASAIAAMVSTASVDRAGPLASVPVVSRLVTLPLPVYPVMVLGLLALLVGLRSWTFALAVFFAWLPIEDLVRKLADNDIRVYVVKYALYAIALMGILPHLRGRWRRVLGDAWAPTVALIGYAALMAVPAAALNPQVPVVGMTVRFGFIGLLPVGAFLAANRDRLYRALAWLGGLGAATCAVGIAQSIIGPTFLNPSAPVANLPHLVVVRALGSALVVRPSGPFADTGRFGSMTVVTVVLGVCLVRVANTRLTRQYGLVTTAVGLGGAFASGGRSSFVIAVLLATLGLAVGSGTRTASFIVRAAIVVAIVVVGATATGTIQELASNRVSYYVQSLNPSDQNSEVAKRVSYWQEEALRGIKAGGALGKGTGTQSIGRQYVTGSVPETSSESGWGNLATEGGMVGVGLWLFWTYRWLRRSIRAARIGTESAAGPVLPAIALFHGAVLVYLFTVSGATFDDYITNTMFWLLSGVSFAALAPQGGATGSLDRVLSARTNSSASRKASARVALADLSSE